MHDAGRMKPQRAKNHRGAITSCGAVVVFALVVGPATANAQNQVLECTMAESLAKQNRTREATEFARLCAQSRSTLVGFCSRPSSGS